MWGTWGQVLRVLKILAVPQPVWLSWVGIILQTERLLVWFPIWAHTWVGFGPRSGSTQKATNGCFSLTLMILTLSFSLASPLSKIKINKNSCSTLVENHCSISRVWRICLSMSVTMKIRILRVLVWKWPQTTGSFYKYYKTELHSQNQGYFSQQSCPSLQASLNWFMPNNSIPYELTYGRGTFCKKISYQKVMWTHTTPEIFLWSQLLV